MEELEYTPWYCVRNLTVGIMHEGRPANVRLPWVCAESAEALVVTAEFMAHLNVSKLKDHYRKGEEDE